MPKADIHIRLIDAIYLATRQDDGDGVSFAPGENFHSVMRHLDKYWLHIVVEDDNTVIVEKEPRL